jgi:hypothetical protein
MESQLGDGISIDQYIYLLSQQIEHDRKLLKYFESINDKGKSVLVAERIPIMTDELKEAIEFAKSQK